MRRVLITGMSGVGKSSVALRLNALGHKAVDMDGPEYTQHVVFERPDRYGSTEDWIWREDRLSELLDQEDADVLFVCGTATNMAKFYPRFDRVVLLTASDGLIVERMTKRTNNPYGHEAGDVERQLALKPIVEPMLRRAADAVIDTSAPLDDVVRRIVAIAASPRPA